MSALFKKTNLLKTRNRQGGWTFLGLLSILIVAGVFVAVGFKLAPAYQDHRTLQSILQDMVADRHLMSESKHAIKTRLSKRFTINSMYEFPRDAVKIEKDKGTVLLIAKYERRFPIFMNVDAVVHFDEVYEGQELD